MGSSINNVTLTREETASSGLLHDAGFQSPVTAGNIFCELTPPAGNYRVILNRLAYGNGTPSIANNSYFFIGGDQYTLSTGGILGILYRYEFYITLDGSTSIGLAAVGNGSANIGVTAGITAIRLP